jgi:peroxiredoxin
MNSMIRTLIFCLLASSGVMAQTPAQTIPVFDFYRFDKTTFTNKNLTPGKMSFFMFFDCDCDHCQHAMTNLNKNFQEYKKASIYLISLDDQQKINAFVGKYAPNLKGKKM